MTAPVIAFAASVKSFEFGGEKMWRRQGTNDLARGECNRDRLLERIAIPAIGKAENCRVGGHEVKKEFAYPPAADGRFRALVRRKTQLPKFFFLKMVVVTRAGFGNHVYIAGDANGRYEWVGYEKPGGAAADKDELLKQWAKSRGHEFEHGNVWVAGPHVRRSPSSFAANCCSRRLPMRMASTSASNS